MFDNAYAGTYAYMSGGQQVLNKGPKQTLRQDGGTTTQFPDGTLILDNRDRTARMIYSPDGKRELWQKNGPCITWTPDNMKVTVYPEGSKLTEFPDGRQIAVTRDGTCTVFDTDGTVATYDKSGRLMNARRTLKN